MTSPEILPKTYLIIRADGTEELFNERPVMWRIMKQIDASCLDSVTVNRSKRVMMLVDDTGVCDGKPVNEKATRYYHAVCRPGTTHCIHGDVALVNDNDFV